MKLAILNLIALKSQAYQANLYTVDPELKVQFIQDSFFSENLESYSLHWKNRATLKHRMFVKLEMIDHSASCDWFFKPASMPELEVAKNQDICYLPWSYGEDSSGIQTRAAMYRIDTTQLGEAGELTIRCQPYRETNWITRGCPVSTGDLFLDPPFASTKYFSYSAIQAVSISEIVLVAFTSTYIWWNRADSGCEQAIMNGIDFLLILFTEGYYSIGNFTNAESPKPIFDYAILYFTTSLTDCMYSDNIISEASTFIGDFFRYGDRIGESSDCTKIGAEWNIWP